MNFNSREVAKSLGKSHVYVMGKVRKVLSELTEIGIPTGEVVETYFLSNNRKFKMYEFDRKFLFLLTSEFKGDKVNEFRLKIVNQFNEMQNQINAMQDELNEMDPIERAKLFIEQQKQLKGGELT